MKNGKRIHRKEENGICNIRYPQKRIKIERKKA